eukprot:13622477-Alexandrium_andersonii.AAC.1
MPTRQKKSERPLQWTVKAVLPRPQPRGQPTQGPRVHVQKGNCTTAEAALGHDSEAQTATNRAGKHALPTGEPKPAT